jgi:hypothetical protein
MSKLKKIITSPIVTIGSFALAAGLLIFSSVGGARAALTYYSETYSSRVEMFDIGVTLLENGNAVSWRNYDSKKADGTWNDATGVLLSELIPEGEEMQLGKAYPEELSVRNSGTINQYVRVNIYKYWLSAEDENGDRSKLQSLSPDLIKLNLVNLGSDWIVDESASTAERTVLYYNKVLGSGETTPLFADMLSIDDSLPVRVTQTTETSGGYTTITTVYDYDGVQFCIEAEVDAVQEHNAEDAIWSAWGRRVNVSDGVLSLK